MAFSFMFATCVGKATKLAPHLTGIFVMSVGEPASNWNVLFVAGSSHDLITCVSIPVSMCQIYMDYLLRLAAVGEGTSRPLTMFEMRSVTSSDFNRFFYLELERDKKCFSLWPSCFDSIFASHNI
jgi:hypothetical protein